MSEATEIYAKVTNVLAEVLVVNEDDITRAAALQRDLGADSLDLLEIIFRLEHEFGIEIPRGELFPSSKNQMGPESAKADKLTARGMVEHNSHAPYAGRNGFKDDLRLSAVQDLLTVGLVADYVTWKLGHDAGDEKDSPASEKRIRRGNFKRDAKGND